MRAMVRLLGRLKMVLEVEFLLSDMANGYDGLRYDTAKSAIFIPKLHFL